MLFVPPSIPFMVPEAESSHGAIPDGGSAISPADWAAAGMANGWDFRGVPLTTDASFVIQRHTTGVYSFELGSQPGNDPATYGINVHHVWIDKDTPNEIFSWWDHESGTCITGSNFEWHGFDVSIGYESTCSSAISVNNPQTDVYKLQVNAQYLTEGEHTFKWTTMGYLDQGDFVAHRTYGGQGESPFLIGEYDITPPVMTMPTHVMTPPGSDGTPLSLAFLPTVGQQYQFSVPVTDDVSESISVFCDDVTTMDGGIGTIPSGPGYWIQTLSVEDTNGFLWDPPDHLSAYPAGTDEYRTFIFTVLTTWEQSYIADINCMATDEAGNKAYEKLTLTILAPDTTPAGLTIWQEYDLDEHHDGCYGVDQNPHLLPGNIFPMATTCTEGLVVSWQDTSLITVTGSGSQYLPLISGPDCSPGRGSHFPIGDTTVTCIAVDQGGTMLTVSFTIRVFLEDLSVCSSPCFDESGTYVDTTPPSQNYDVTAYYDGYGDSYGESVTVFFPSELTINVGDSVTWTHDPNSIHSYNRIYATWLDDACGSELPQVYPHHLVCIGTGSPFMGAGFYAPSSYTHTFDQVGTYVYTDHIFGNCQNLGNIPSTCPIGTINVVESGAPPPVVVNIPPPDTTAAAPTAQVNVMNNVGSSTPGCEETNSCFLPSIVTINVGGTVTWLNEVDSAAHTSTAGSPTDGPSGVFDSSLIMVGSSFSHTFDEAGIFDYFCAVHPWMQGTVIVGDVSAAEAAAAVIEAEPEMEPEPQTINVSVNKSSFVVGETITISGNIENYDGTTYDVAIKIIGSNGNLVAITQTVPSYYGSFSDSVGGNFGAGTYTVVAMWTSQESETTFQIVVPDSTQNWALVTNAPGSSTPGCEETSDGCFIPNPVIISVGDTVTWENNDTAAHTSTAGSSTEGPTGVWDSSLIMAGSSFTHIFDDPGVFDYFCMVHPWMNGTVIVEGDAAAAAEAAEAAAAAEAAEAAAAEAAAAEAAAEAAAPQPDLQVYANQSEYNFNEEISLNVSLDNTTSNEMVVIDVLDSSGNSVVTRIVTVSPNDSESIEFKISDNFLTGNYKVLAAGTIDGDTIMDITYFKIKSAYNQFQIASVTVSDQLGNPSTLSKGTLGYIKVELTSTVSIPALVTVNLFDSDLTTLGVGSVRSTVSEGESEIILSFLIPDDAALGDAEIFVNAFTDWISNGGIPLTPEVSISEEIT